MVDALTTAATEILKNSFDITVDDFGWQLPREEGHGDRATSIALSLAKKLQKKPQEIAAVLAEGLAKIEGIEKAEVAGPGYVNITFTPSALIKSLSQARGSIKAKTPRKKEAPVIMEFSQPNIAKPLGAHHIIGTVLGQVLVNIYRHQGFNVMSWNYIGDWGTQFGKLAVAFEKWGTKPAKDCTLDELLALYVKFHEEAEKDETLEDQGRAAFAKLEQGDKALRSFWSDIVTVTKSSLQGIYERLQVSFDEDKGESFYEDKTQPVIEEGIAKGVFHEGKEGSLIAEFPEETGLPPYLVRKGDGATLYSTRDLAQMKYRMEEYAPSAIYILTDIAQKLHFEQLVATCAQLGWTLPAFENVLFGRMRFADKAMSTRKGNILKLEHLLDEAVARADAIIKERGDAIQSDDPSDLADMMGIGAVVYGILSQNRKMDLVFDWGKMLSFEGNSAPYLQYTHARARSVLRKADTESMAYPAHIAAVTDHERRLLRTLLQFEDVLAKAQETRLPHKLTNYLYQLCQDFNSFYSAQPIAKAEEPLRTFRLALTSHAAEVLKTGATLLTIRVPDRM